MAIFFSVGRRRSQEKEEEDGEMISESEVRVDGHSIIFSQGERKRREWNKKKQEPKEETLKSIPSRSQ